MIDTRPWRQRWSCWIFHSINWHMVVTMRNNVIFWGPHWPGETYETVNWCAKCQCRLNWGRP